MARRLLPHPGRPVPYPAHEEKEPRERLHPGQYVRYHGRAKKDDLGQVSFKTGGLQKFFPKSYTPRQMNDTIRHLLEQWQRRRQRDQQR